MRAGVPETSLRDGHKQKPESAGKYFLSISVIIVLAALSIFIALVLAEIYRHPCAWQLNRSSAGIVRGKKRRDPRSGDNGDDHAPDGMTG